MMMTKQIKLNNNFIQGKKIQDNLILHLICGIIINKVQILDSPFIQLMEEE